MKTSAFLLDTAKEQHHSWYFRNALVRANYNDLKNGVHATTKFLEQFFSNLLMGTSYDLKNRYMYMDYVEEPENDDFQSVNSKALKCQTDTLECTLEELAILKFIVEDNSIKQNELVKRTGKSLSTVKRAMESLKKKNFIRRINGKRYGRWEVLVEIERLER